MASAEVAHKMPRKTHLLNLVSPKPRDHINDNPGKRPAEIDGLVHDKGHDASGKNIVLHVGVPRQP